MTEIELAIANYRRIEVERDLTEKEERRMVALLRCAAEDRREEEGK